MQEFGADAIFEPSSLWECHQLLTSPLPRDHYLVRGVDRRNRLTVGDVICGQGTEPLSESHNRREAALKNLSFYLDEISDRNCSVLGCGIVHALLNTETDADEDGVPIDEDESRICDQIGSILLEIQRKTSNPKLLTDLTSSILCNKEVLVYQKYKLLKSIRSGVKSLQFSPPADQPITTGSPTFSIKRWSPSEVVVVRDRFCATLSISLSQGLSSVLAAPESWFPEKVLLGELAETIVIVTEGLGESSLIDTVVLQFLRVLKKQSKVDEDTVKCFLRLVMTDKHALVRLVEDEEVAFLLKSVLEKLAIIDSLPEEVKATVKSLRDCVSTPT